MRHVSDRQFSPRVQVRTSAIQTGEDRLLSVDGPARPLGIALSADPSNPESPLVGVINSILRMETTHMCCLTSFDGAALDSALSSCLKCWGDRGRILQDGSAIM